MTADTSLLAVLEQVVPAVLALLVAPAPAALAPAALVLVGPLHQPRLLLAPATMLQPAAPHQPLRVRRQLQAATTAGGVDEGVAVAEEAVVDLWPELTLHKHSH